VSQPSPWCNKEILLIGTRGFDCSGRRLKHMKWHNPATISIQHKEWSCRVHTRSDGFLKGCARRFIRGPGYHHARHMSIRACDLFVWVFCTGVTRRVVIPGDTHRTNLPGKDTESLKGIGVDDSSPSQDGGQHGERRSKRVCRSLWDLTLVISQSICVFGCKILWDQHHRSNGVVLVTLWHPLSGRWWDPHQGVIGVDIWRTRGKVTGSISL